MVPISRVRDSAEMSSLESHLWDLVTKIHKSFGKIRSQSLDLLCPSSDGDAWHITYYKCLKTLARWVGGWMGGQTDEWAGPGDLSEPSHRGLHLAVSLWEGALLFPTLIL